MSTAPDTTYGPWWIPSDPPTGVPAEASVDISGAEMISADPPTCRPFFKWPGGKRSLAPEIVELLGPIPGGYIESFAGGAAVFFHLRATGFTGPATLNDFNPTVANAYRQVQVDPDAVHAAFLRYVERDSKAFYLSVRQEAPISDPVDWAAWFLYLNRAGFNGLWRVNQGGIFNVPYGAYANPPSVALALLHEAAKALRNTTITCQDFAVADLPEGSRVYGDPPYIPVSKTASFTAYTRAGFGPADQLRLATWARRQADVRGCQIVLSNAGGPDSLQAFQATADQVVPVTERRAINRKGDSRGPIAAYLFLYTSRSA